MDVTILQTLEITGTGLCVEADSSLMCHYYKTNFHGDSVIFVRRPLDWCFMPKDPDKITIMYADPIPTMSY